MRHARFAVMPGSLLIAGNFARGLLWTMHSPQLTAPYGGGLFGWRNVDVNC